MSRAFVRVFAATGGVVAFWWGMTGLLLALERSGATRRLALGLAVLAAGGGIACIRRARRGTTTWAGAAAVLGGVLLWTCVSAAFYSGWVVGPVPTTPSLAPAGASAPSLARAVEALAATAYSTVLAAALLALACWVARAPQPRTTRSAIASPNVARYAPVTFATLWAAHEVAKLNVFLGVASPGARYLPAYLAHLRRYFGPLHNSPLLAWTVLALGVATALMGWGAFRTKHDPGRRAARALLAGILALAALEHALLGVRTPPGWWNGFVAWRQASPTRGPDALRVSPAPRPSTW